MIVIIDKIFGYLVCFNNVEGVIVLVIEGIENGFFWVVVM